LGRELLTADTILIRFAARTNSLLTDQEQDTYTSSIQAIPLTKTTVKY
jgi:succinate dehydrogenase flavin-adding protein (antitoxin of CptAB toxin-antitoxin module)